VARQGDFKILQLEFPSDPFTEAMFWHPRLTSDPAHRWLRAFLKECTAAIDC
jgi:DNA-binding transcriptional LysR family regulator